MKVLETERLVLRRLTDDDAPFLLGLLNQPSFIRNIGDRGVRTVEAAREYGAKGPIASYRDNGYGLYVVERKDDAAAIGLCGLVKRSFLDDPDIGFAYLPDFWSQGYALEAARAVMEYARGTLGIHRVVAIVSPGNEPSIRLLRKLGLQFERMMDMPTPGDVVAFYVPAVP